MEVESYRIQNFLSEVTEQIYDDIACLVLTICEVASCFLVFNYDEHVIFKAGFERSKGSMVAVKKIPKDKFSSFLNDSIKTISDLEKNPISGLDIFPKSEDRPYRFYAGIPLVSAKGPRTLLGIISVLDYVPKELSKEQIHGLQVLSKQIINQMELEFQNRQLAEAKEELQQKNQELQAINDERSSFLGMIGHDIRQPLCSVQVSSEMLAHEMKPDDPSLELVESIQSSADFMSFLMDNLLHVTRESQGPIELNLRTVDPLVVINRIILANRRLASRKEIQLNLRIEIEGDHKRCKMSVLMDVFRIEQVLNNLISNAIKFSFPSSCVEVIVGKLSTNNDEVTAEFLTVNVQDKGQGIPSNEIPNLFDSTKKISTKPTGNENSTGLGLSIVKRIVNQHGGEVGASSIQGKGSTFWFTLPLIGSGHNHMPAPDFIRPTKTQSTTSSVAHTRDESTYDNVDIGDSPLHTFSILVAEDNPLNQKLVQAVLSKRGHRVKTVNNGLEAVEAFSQFPFDVVLLDHEMPVMNGLEACLAIREKNQMVPVISMSGTINQQIEELRQKSGMNRFITKPFKVKRLLGIVEDAYEDFRKQMEQLRSSSGYTKAPTLCH